MNSEIFFGWEPDEIDLSPKETEEEVCRRQYEKDMMAEANRDYLESLTPGLKECKISEFVSRSRGKNRKQGKPREIVLFKYKDLTYTIVNGEPRKGNNHKISLDSLAYDILENLPVEDRTVDRLLEETRIINNVKKNNRYNLL